MARTLGLTVACLALLFFSLLPGVATAGTYDQAMAGCQNAKATKTDFSGMNCYVSGQFVNLSGYAIPSGVYVAIVGQWSFTGVYVPPETRCSARPSLLSTYDGSTTTIDWGGCKYRLREDVGATKVCIGYGTNLGKACTGSATWDPTGEATSEDPPNEAPPVPPGPKVCGVGVCYDNGKKQYCEASGGVCVDADTPTHQPPSGCISGGGTTLCVGAPPPLPGNPPIADPSTQIRSSDQFQQSAGLPNVPTITPVTVNNYNTTNNPLDNGAQAGDKGPGAPDDPDAPPKDDSGDKTSASGGQNCNSPPVCEGAQATCMVVSQTWLLRCKADDGGASNDGDTSVPGLDGIGEGPGEGFHRTETLLDKLDTGGLGGGGQCPNLIVLDLDQYGIHLDGNNSTWCSILDKAGWMLMFLAAFISLRILSEK